jgi:hypothetical protein
MELKRFQVTNFRSVADSGWIEVDRVAALIGVNESGKTNLLLPLWKLRPAREGEIQPTSDYPKKMFGEIRENPGKFCFIRGEFDTGTLAPTLARLTGEAEEQLQTVIVNRYYDGKYSLNFPDCRTAKLVEAAEIQKTLKSSHDDIEQAKALKTEEAAKTEILSTLQEQADQLADAPAQNAAALKSLIKTLQALIPGEPAKSSVIIPRLSDYRSD